MKAILTKCLPATNERSRRVKAYTEGGNSIIVSWDKAEDVAHDVYANTADAVVHKVVAYQLCHKMNWQGFLVGGGTPEGYAFCFRESKI